MNVKEITAELYQTVGFVKNGELIQDLRGHSRALCYILQKPALNSAQKFFLKVYAGDCIEKLKMIAQRYETLQIPTAKTLEIGLLKDSQATYCIYEYLDGPTLHELIDQNSLATMEKYGEQVGKELQKFNQLTGNKKESQENLEAELKTLWQNLLTQKRLYLQARGETLPEIDLSRLQKTLQTLKAVVLAIPPRFTHSDINLDNIILHQKQMYFVDTGGSEIKFRSLDFRGSCWWCWSGEDTKYEQAIYRGIYRGLFDQQIPDCFHQELAFVIIYEFLIRVQKYAGDLEQVHYSFLRWRENLLRTNYFENYQFDWF